MAVPNVPVIHPDDELLSLRAAAEELKLSKQTLLLARIRGELPMREAADRFLIRRQDLEAWKRLRAKRSREKAARA